jgi:hypothetical protein
MNSTQLRVLSFTTGQHLTDSPSAPRVASEHKTSPLGHIVAAT